MQTGARRTIENLPNLMYRQFYSNHWMTIAFEQTADYEDAHAAWSEVMSVLSGFVWDLD